MSRFALAPLLRAGAGSAGEDRYGRVAEPTPQVRREKRLFFEPNAVPEERGILVQPIARFRTRHGAALRWSAKEGRFVAP